MLQLPAISLPPAGTQVCPSWIDTASTVLSDDSLSWQHICCCLSSVLCLGRSLRFDIGCRLPSVNRSSSPRRCCVIVGERQLPKWRSLRSGGCACLVWLGLRSSWRSSLQGGPWNSRRLEQHCIGFWRPGGFLAGVEGICGNSEWTLRFLSTLTRARSDHVVWNELALSWPTSWSFAKSLRNLWRTWAHLSPI